MFLVDLFLEVESFRSTVEPLKGGPHFNPDKKKHGAPDAAERHAGDMGNVEATADGCTFTITDSQIPLSGPNSIVGRACVIHELEDDLGRGLTPAITHENLLPRGIHKRVIIPDALSLYLTSFLFLLLDVDFYFCYFFLFFSGAE